MRQFWRCAAAWMAPPAPVCTEAGEGDRGAEKHTQTTGHTTVTTIRPDWNPLEDRTADTSVWCQDDKHERCRTPDCACGCHHHETEAPG